MRIKTAYINLLETSTVSLASGTERTDRPLRRLYDRKMGVPFSPDGTGLTEVLIDQAGSMQPIDRMLIPGGHNLDGMDIDIQYSDDAILFTSTTGGMWTQSGNDLINKSWSPIVKRYWKIVINPVGTAPEIMELFLTSTYTWERDPGRGGSGPFGHEFNVERICSSAGQTRYIIHGDMKRRRRYSVPNAGETQMSNLLDLNYSCGNGMPFWLRDHEGAWIYGELSSPVNTRPVVSGRYSVDFDFLEIAK